MLYRLIAVSCTAVLPAQNLLLPAESYAAATTPAGGVHVVDADLDGAPDIFVGSDLLRGDGSGGFVASNVRTPLFDLSGFAVGPVGAFDLDLDGDLDVVYRDGVWIDNGGVYADETAARIGGTLATGSRIELVYDADNDGDLDLLAVRIESTGGSYQLLYLDTALNDGTGNFPTATTRYLAGGTFLGFNGKIVAGDFDGDAFVDLAFSGYWGDAGSSGQFGGIYPSSALSALPGSNALAGRDLDAVADFDGDGRDDILTTRSWGVSVWFGGSGFSTNYGAGYGGYVGDFDGDGDQDCVTRSPNGAAFSLGLNDGAGAFTFSPLTIPSPPTANASIAFADVDLDGDADIVLADAPRVLRNARQQLSAPATVAPGATLTLTIDAVDTSGPLDGVAVNALAVSPAIVPIGALGTLLIDPNAFALLPFSILTGGQGTTTWTLPSTPTITGVELFAQSLVDDTGGRLHLTNRTRTLVQ